MGGVEGVEGSGGSEALGGNSLHGIGKLYTLHQKINESWQLLIGDIIGVDGLRSDYGASLRVGYS